MIGLAGLPPGRYRRVDEHAGLTLSDITDAILFFGPVHTLSPLPVPDDLWQDDAFWNELNRRNELLFGRSLDLRIRQQRGRMEAHE